MPAVFVFGSNLVGRHGAGSAKEAVAKWGAKHGVGIGRTGMAYAIPTKDARLRTLSIDTIRRHVDTFIAYAWENPDITFILVAIGTGLAGYTHEEMKPLFDRAPRNVIKPTEWR